MCMLVEEGTQGLHFCRLQKIRDDPIDPATSKHTRLQSVHNLARQFSE